MLKLLGKSTSINVRKVLWTLDELALAHEHEQWGSGFRATDTAEFTALNPNAMVPVLVDGDFVLWESNSICRYLANSYGGAALLPLEPARRAMVEQWMDWQATELNNAWRYAFMALVRNSPAHRDQAAVDAGIAGWNRHMAILDRQLDRTGAFACGDAFTLADVVLGLAVNRWAMTPFDHPALPAVQAYYDRLAQRPGFRKHGRNGTA
jgi:glutathione S-transferase